MSQYIEIPGGLAYPSFDVSTHKLLEGLRLNLASRGGGRAELMVVIVFLAQCKRFLRQGN
jgi:hypothetical protein